MKKKKPMKFEDEYALMIQRQSRIVTGLTVLGISALMFLCFFGCAPNPKPRPAATEVVVIPDIPVTQHEEVEVPFDFNSDQPLASAALFDRAYDMITIEGYADARGTEAYNTALSLRRANAVVAALRVLEISGKISVVAYGKTKLLCYDTSESCHARNRRVVIRTTKEVSLAR